MPYDFTFKRVTILDNQTALTRNISLAIELTNSFPEVNDANSPDSDFYFTKAAIDTNKEFPELHFYLEADIDGFFYHFSFWKDNLYVELGAGGDTGKRFGHLRDYSKIILRHDFEIEEPWGDKLLSQDIGFERHIQEYNKWAGFVDRVKHNMNP
jgi:hypothetical protein